MHYRRLRQRVEFFAAGTVLDWDARAAQEFIRLRNLRLGIGTMDLRIASIALSSGGLLLTRNLADFGKVPGLRAENWLDWGRSRRGWDARRPGTRDAQAQRSLPNISSQL